MDDLADVVARLTGALRVGPDRAASFARAVTLVKPRTAMELKWCAQATLAVSFQDLEQLERAFEATEEPGAEEVAIAEKVIASDQERLQHKEFGELTPEELGMLAAAMARLKVAPPPRRSRRTSPGTKGKRLDLRATLRRAQGGEPLKLLRRRRRQRPRRLVVLCDISGSMEPYARAMLQLLYCAAGTRQAEVFSFATKLTRLTSVLAKESPARALAHAGEIAPDWSSGTRIGPAIQEFLDRYGRAGMARGAVMLIISDGWETGDPALLGRQMARLSRVAFRIVWVNPRAQSPRYQPLAAGMAAAWPYCDAVVSAHNFEALEDLTRAIAGGVSAD